MKKRNPYENFSTPKPKHCLKFVVEFVTEVVMLKSQRNEFKDETSQQGFSVLDSLSER